MAVDQEAGDPPGFGRREPSGSAAGENAGTKAEEKAQAGAGTKAVAGVRTKAVAGVGTKAVAGVGTKAVAGVGTKAVAGVGTKAVAGAGTKAGTRAQAGAGDGVAEKATFRLAAFGALLVVVLFAGYGLGRLNNGAASTVSTGAPAAATTSADATADMPGMAMGEGQPHVHNADGTVTQARAAAGQPAGSVVGGLSLSSGGLTLVPLKTVFPAGPRERLRFRITGSGGVPITTFAVVHDKLLHLIVVRRDLTGYQHLHPVMAPDGTWSVDLALTQPGIYRMIADFTAVVGGQPVAAALGSDLTVAGTYVPAALPAPARAVRAAGYAVAYEGTPSVRSVQPVLISVTGPDRRPAPLQPYLGAFGHLVMIRLGDLGYVHVHPETQLVDGKVKFWLTAPSPGTYRLFFDFQVAGHVHTATWTAVVS